MTLDLSQAAYQAHRTTILSLGQRKEAMVQASVTASVAVVAYGGSLQNPFIMLGALLIILGAYNYICHSIYAVRRCATFLRVYYGDTWEVTLHKLHKMRKNKPKIRIERNFLMLWTAGLVPLGSASVTAYKAASAAHVPNINNQPASIAFIVAVLAASILWCCVAIHMWWKNGQLCSGGKIEREFEEDFTELLKEPPTNHDNELASSNRAVVEMAHQQNLVE